MFVNDVSTQASAQNSVISKNHGVKVNPPGKSRHSPIELIEKCVRLVWTKDEIRPIFRPADRRTRKIEREDSPTPEVNVCFPL